MMDFSAERAWTMLDPRPVIMYLPEHDEYMCMWNGTIMPFLHAQCLAAEFIGIYQSPSVKEALDDHYHKLYYAGAFGTRAWDQAVQHRNTFILLQNIMNKHLLKVLDNRPGPEIMSWFDVRNASVKVSNA